MARFQGILNHCFDTSLPQISGACSDRRLAIIPDNYGRRALPSRSNNKRLGFASTAASSGPRSPTWNIGTFQFLWISATFIISSLPFVALQTLLLLDQLLIELPVRLVVFGGGTLI